MNTTDDKEKHHAQDLRAVVEPAASTRLAAEQVTLAGSFQAERSCGAKAEFRSRFLTALLRALSAWPA